MLIDYWIIISCIDDKTLIIKNKNQQNYVLFITVCSLYNNYFDYTDQKRGKILKRATQPEN